MNCPDLVTHGNRELPQGHDWIRVLCLNEEQLKERQKRAFLLQKANARSVWLRQYSRVFNGDYHQKLSGRELEKLTWVHCSVNKKYLCCQDW